MVHHGDGALVFGYPITRKTILYFKQGRKHCMSGKAYSKDVCAVCGKRLLVGHLSPYCQEHYIEHRRQEKLNLWLDSGETGMTVDTTIRGVIRDYILEQQNECCAICGITNEWNGMKLNFVLDHINGDAAESSRDNLRLICPNCDSQLDTYKSRNKNSSRNKRKEFLKNTTIRKNTTIMEG